MTGPACSRCGRPLLMVGGSVPVCAFCLLRAGTGRDYSLVSVLGQGAHGTVYLAEQQPSKRLVALKVLNGSDTAATVSRLQHHRRVLAALAHPNASNILDVGRSGDRSAYVATAYVRGLAISTSCERSHADVPARLALLAILTDVVRSAHQRGIAHGGIKASNVFLVDTVDGPSVRVTDFGMRSADVSADLAALRGLATELLQPLNADRLLHA